MKRLVLLAAAFVCVAGAAAPDYLELQGGPLGEVIQHDAMMVNHHVPLLVERLGKTRQVQALLAAGKQAYETRDYYRAFRLYARAAGLAQGEDKLEAAELSASLDLALNRAIVSEGDTLTATVHPLFSLGHPLSAGYRIRLRLETEAGPIAGTGQELAVDDVRVFRFDFAARQLKDGLIAVAYRLTGPGGAILVEFRQPVMVAQDAQKRLERLQARVATFQASASARETVEYQLRALENERTRYDGNWQRRAHPYTAHLNCVNFAAEGRGQSAFPSFVGRLRYPEDIDAAEALLAGRVLAGDLQQAYRAADGELVPYRVFIPQGYRPGRKYPLILALHSGAGEGTYFEWESFGGEGGKQNEFKRLAQEKGYLVACPNSRGSFFDDRGIADTLAVLDRVQTTYSVDPGRVFLTGWSVGASAIWGIAARNPGRFQAIAPVAGAATWLNRENSGALRDLPILFTTGGRDITVAEARRTSQLAHELLANFRYVEHPEVTHGDIWSKALPEVLAFFDRPAAVDSPSTGRIYWVDTRIVDELRNQARRSKGRTLRKAG